MRKIYKLLFCTGIIGLTISSCKVDAPVLPEGVYLKTDTKTGNGNGTGTNPGTGTGTNPGTGTGTDPGTGTGTDPGTGTGTNPGSDVPIGATNTIKVQIGSGAIKTFTTVNFSSVVGINGINGIQSQSDIITVGYIGEKTGVFDIQVINFGNYSLDPAKGGKVTVTESSMTTSIPAKGKIKGTFTMALLDGSGKSAGTANGSFNISQ